ncbi:2201_t:CDS:2, partial [Cetraspora pellucida]
MEFKGFTGFMEFQKKYLTKSKSNNFDRVTGTLGDARGFTKTVTQMSVLKRDLMPKDNYTGMDQRFSSPALVIFSISRQAACSISAGEIS